MLTEFLDSCANKHSMEELKFIVERVGWHAECTVCQYQSTLPSSGGANDCVWGIRKSCNTKQTETNDTAF